MKPRREGGSLKADVTKIASAIKAEKQYENGSHLRPVSISIIYGNSSVPLCLMAIRSSIKNLPFFFFLYGLKLEIITSFCGSYFFFFFFLVSSSFNVLKCGLLLSLIWVWWASQDAQRAPQSLAWGKHPLLLAGRVPINRSAGRLHRGSLPQFSLPPGGGNQQDQQVWDLSPLTSASQPDTAALTFSTSPVEMLASWLLWKGHKSCGRKEGILLGPTFKADEMHDGREEARPEVCPEDTLLSFSRSVVSDSMWPHGLQHARLPCPSLSPGVCSDSWPLSQWCHPSVSSSVTPFSSHLQSFPASGSFLMSQLFTSGG